MNENATTNSAKAQTDLTGAGPAVVRMSAAQLVLQRASGLFRGSAPVKARALWVTVMGLMLAVAIGLWTVVTMSVYRDMTSPATAAASVRVTGFSPLRPKVRAKNKINYSFVLAETTGGSPGATSQATSPKVPSRNPFALVRAATPQSAQSKNTTKPEEQPKPLVGSGGNAKSRNATREPMAKASQDIPESLQRLRLTMTVKTPQGGWATINSRGYHEGDVVEGFTLERVLAGSVRLVKGESICLLKMEEED